MLLQDSTGNRQTLAAWYESNRALLRLVTDWLYPPNLLVTFILSGSLSWRRTNMGGSLRISPFPSPSPRKTRRTMRRRGWRGSSRRLWTERPRPPLASPRPSPWCRVRPLKSALGSARPPREGGRGRCPSVSPVTNPGPPLWRSAR